MRLCLVCKQLVGESNWDPGRGYMVKARVWNSEAGFTYKAGFAHLWCLEKHIGRELGPDDFSMAPINFMSGHVPEHKLPPSSTMLTYFLR